MRERGEREKKRDRERERKVKKIEREIERDIRYVGLFITIQRISKVADFSLSENQ